MFETEEEYRVFKARATSMGDDERKGAIETIEALRDMARWAYHPDHCHTQMTGDRPCNCGYQELKDALPDWITEEGIPR